MIVKAVNRLPLFLLLILIWRSALALPASVLRADEILLDDLVVTGTKTPKTLKEGPVKTEVVSEAEIKSNRYRDASEAIQDIPGVTLTEPTGKQGQTAIIQGLGSEHVLVLVDGAPLLQNSSTGVDLTQIPAADIQKIEVIKGGASALYGGQAMGGVINVITKSPDDGAKYELEVTRDQSLDPGDQQAPSYNLVKAHLRGRVAKTRYKVNLNHRQEASLDRDSSSLSHDTPDLAKFGAGVFLEQELTEKHRLQVDLGYNKESSRSYAARLLPNSQYSPIYNDGDISRQRVKLGYFGNLDQNRSANFYVLSERIDDRLSLADDPQTSEMESLKSSDLRRERAEGQYDFSWVDDHITSLGFVVERNSLNQATDTVITPGQNKHTTEVDAKSSRSLEAYIQDDWIFPRAELVSGLRASRDLDFGTHLDPKLNLMLNPEWLSDVQTTFRFALGSGYRVPNLKERFYVLDHRSWAGYIVYGNENLSPEESLSFQAGVELTRGKTWSTHFNAYLNQVRGLITTEEVATGTTERAFRFENIEEARIYGLEASGSWQPFLRWKLVPALTYTKAVNEPSGLIIANRPFHTAQLSTRYELKPDRTELSLTYRYYGDSYANAENTEMYHAYDILDLRLNHRLNSKTQFYLGLRNLLDVKREARVDDPALIFDQRPDQGRVLFVGLSVEG